jgi:sugar phosphate isomerase/epimerase
MKRRAFIQTLGAAAAGSVFIPTAPPFKSAKKLDRIGLELYAVRRAMQKDPDGTLAAVRAAGYTDVELLWSFGNFGRSTQQVVAALKQNGLRAPSAHISPILLFIGWQRSLDTAKEIGQDYLIVPDFGESVKTLDDWKEWADHFNTAGAAARKSGLWLAFHNEADHMKPLDASGQIPYDVFVERLDPAVTRLQLDVGNMLIGGGDPMQYLAKYKDRYWTFHLKDVVPDRSSDTRLGKGIFDFKKFLAAVPNLEQKPCYVEDESPTDEMAAAKSNCQYLQTLDF